MIEYPIGREPVSSLPIEPASRSNLDKGFNPLTMILFVALLIAAIMWNLGTWYFGLPASSSHTLIGLIIGVGVANALMRGRDGTSGVDWGKSTEIGYALLLSPLVARLACLRASQCFLHKSDAAGVG